MCGYDLSSSLFLFSFSLLYSAFCFLLSSSRVNFTCAVVGLTGPEMKCVRECVHQTSDDDKGCKSVRQCLCVVNACVASYILWTGTGRTEVTTKEKATDAVYFYCFHTLLTALNTFTRIKCNDSGGNMCKI